MITDSATDITDLRRPLIEISNLTKTYRRLGGTTITPVDNISLTVERGELVVLLGPSGCGKTTLLRCLAGLEKPDEGEIRIDGEVVFSSRKSIFVPSERRRLSMIFQSYALWPHMTVAKNIAYPLESRGTPRHEIADRVQKVLELVGIDGLDEQYPGRLSGGQQQRVALARALVSNTHTVLFDEPLSNVDAQVRAQLRFELKRMQRQIQFCGVYVTHDQTEAMELGHKIIVLDSGRIAAEGPPRQVYDYPPNAYVANFVGTANLIDGTVVRAESDSAVVETPLGQHVVHTQTSPQAGSTVKVVLRPETLAVNLSPPPPDSKNAVPMTVEAINFSGSHTEVVLNSGGMLIRAWMQNAEDGLVEGGDVWLIIDPARARLIPAASTETVEAASR